MRETTAAAVILHSGWKRKFPLYDPFCGSGTIAIEAAMYAWDMAPGIGRNFALGQLLPGDKKTEQRVREEFIGKIDFSRLVRIAGSDQEAGLVKAAQANMKRALALCACNEVSGQNAGNKTPSFRVLPMEKAEPLESAAEIPDSSGGFIITNPPYGRRLGDAESSEKIYAEMGCLTRNFPGWKLALITDHPGFESFFGRKADSCREITNGAIRSYLYLYEKI